MRAKDSHNNLCIPIADSPVLSQSLCAFAPLREIYPAQKDASRKAAKNALRMSLIQFISAFGLGAIVTAIVQAWLSNRAEIWRRNFQEKKECYVGLLEAYRQAAVESTHETSAIKEMIDSSAYSLERGVALERLQKAMRRDLGISK
jgi:hypothetical protein